MLRRKLVYLLPVWLVVGCVSTSYWTHYDMYLIKSDPPDSLRFKDERFEFRFHDEPNGVVFQVRNLGEKPAFLQWDRSYFIEPDGNSYKALNTDLIHENSETKEKEKYESVIPPNGILLRFTTSALNSKRFELFDFGIYNSGNITMVNETKTSIPWYGNYHRPEYEPTFAPQDSLHKHDLGFKAIENYVRQKNNMGLGLSIKLNDTTTMDYKFDFRIKNVKIWKITTSVNGATEKTKKDTALFKSISEENGWIWK